MSISKNLTVSLLAGGLLFGAVGCSTSETEADPAPAPASSSSASASPEVTVDQTAEDKKAIAGVITEVFDFASQPDNLLALQELGTKATGTDDEIAKILRDSGLKGFEYYEDNDNLDLALAYLNMATVSASLYEKGLANTDIDIPEDAITVDGDTAVYDESATGSVFTANMAPDKVDIKDANSNKVSLIKEDGKWLIQAPEIKTPGLF